MSDSDSERSYSDDDDYLVSPAQLNLIKQYAKDIKDNAEILVESLDFTYISDYNYRAYIYEINKQLIFSALQKFCFMHEKINNTDYVKDIKFFVDMLMFNEYFLESKMNNREIDFTYEDELFKKYKKDKYTVKSSHKRGMNALYRYCLQISNTRRNIYCHALRENTNNLVSELIDLNRIINYYEKIYH